MKKKIREINLLIKCKQISLNAERQTIISCCLFCHCHETHSDLKLYYLHIHMEDKQMMTTEKMQQKSNQHAGQALEEIIGTHAGQALEEIIGTQLLLACSIHIATGSSKVPNRQYSQPAKLLSNKFSKCYSNAFKKYWNNTKTVCLNIILQTWDMFLHTRLTEFHIFFITRSATFLAQLSS